MRTHGPRHTPALLGEIGPFTVLWAGVAMVLPVGSGEPPEPSSDVSRMSVVGTAGEAPAQLVFCSLSMPA